MLKSLTTTFVRLLLATLIAVLAWYGVYSLTTSQPHHARIPQLMESAPFPTPVPWVEPRQFRFDRTGWWFVVGPSRFNGETGPMTWQVHHLKTGEVSSFQWNDTLDPECWVPLEAGYRHTRNTKDGGIEVVDTSFVDGKSTVRLKFARGHLAEQRVFFSHDGSRAVTTHRMPLLKLFNLSLSPALACADEMIMSVSKWHDQAHDVCHREVRFWKLPDGTQERSFLLPAFTETNGLKLSPCGRWLMRLEPTFSQYHMYTDLRYLRNERVSFVPIEPRGVVVCDGQTGTTKVLSPCTTHPSHGYYVGYINENGLVLSRILAGANPKSGIVSFGIDGNVRDPSPAFPMYATPDFHQLTWWGIIGGSSTAQSLPVRTIDGVTVALSYQNKEQTVSAVTLTDPIQLSNTQVVIPTGNRPTLAPLSEPGQVLVTYEPYRAYQKWMDWFKEKLNYDIENYLPVQQVVTACIVDVHRQSIVWSGSLTVPHNPAANLIPYIYDQRANLAASPPQFTTTWDRTALWACYVADKDFHLYRWELPLVSWSPAWSIGAGVFAFLAMMWLTRKRQLNSLMIAPPHP